MQIFIFISTIFGNHNPKLFFFSSVDAVSTTRCPFLRVRSRRSVREVV